MTTTAYPPSIGGVQAYVADLKTRLTEYEVDVATLWTRNRTDWLLGTTVSLGPSDSTADARILGWPTSVRLRMLPWVASYYALIPVAAERIARMMAPYVEDLLRPEHVLIHNHRIGREFLALASLEVARRRGLAFVLSSYHHPNWKGYLYSGWLRAYRAADA